MFIDENCRRHAFATSHDTINFDSETAFAGLNDFVKELRHQQSAQGEMKDFERVFNLFKRHVHG